MKPHEWCFVVANLVLAVFTIALIWILKTSPGTKDDKQQASFWIGIVLAAAVVVNTVGVVLQTLDSPR